MSPSLRRVLVVAATVSVGCAASRAPLPVAVTCVVRSETPAPAPCACPTPPPAPAVVAPPTAPARTGGTVARWGASWQRAAVLGPVCAGFVRVRFEAGTVDDAVEVVSVRDVQETDAHGRLPEVHATPPGDPVTAGTRLAPGRALLALSGGTWYPARVRAVRRDGTVRIRYDGYDAEWDENLARDALRLPDSDGLTHPVGAAEPRGATLPDDAPLAPGAPVVARSRGRWYDARVLGTECGGLVRVHFVGWEPAWDAVVPRAHVRAR